MMDQRIEHLDTSVFAVPSSTSEGDKQSILRMAELSKRLYGRYTFLEVGSYLGGGLYPHLVNPNCRRVVSIDSRPDHIHDDIRAIPASYKGNTCATMIAALRPHCTPEELAKLSTFDADASNVSPGMIGERVDCAFIDGEHTNVAAFSDFVSIFPVLNDSAIVGFHDANLVIDAIYNVSAFLRYLLRRHKMFFIPDVVCVIALGNSMDSAAEYLSAAALDEKTFVRDAKRRLREEIASAVQHGLHLLT